MTLDVATAAFPVHPIYTFKEFKEKYMTKKEIVGYKLIKPHYENAVKHIVGSWWNEHAKTNLIKDGWNFAANWGDNKMAIGAVLKEAGVLDIWFEPVYAPEKPKEKVISLGRFDLTVKSTGIFHKTEDITSYVKEMVSWWKNDCEGGKMKFGPKNYVCSIQPSDVFIEKTGCEAVETTLLQWLNVWDEYLILK